MIDICKAVLDIKEEVIKLRRILHSIPEPGLQEFETTKFIYNYLKSLDIQTEVCLGNTGVIGVLKGKEGAKTIAFRADIDALSVQEKTELEFASTKPGFMHACGHDGHMAILLGFAKLMSQNRNNLTNNILFIFQPAEEGPGGAEIIVNSGLLKKYDVSCILGLHIYPEIAEGKVGCKPYEMMAQTGEFDIRLLGKSGHGAMPHSANDTLIAMATAIMTLNTIVSRNIDPLEPGVLTIGKVLCGERRNIIPGEAILEGTIRAFNDETYQIIRNRLENAIKGIAQAYECIVQYEIRDMYPAVNNSEALVKQLIDAVGIGNYESIKPLTISEDFSYYQKQIPGLFFLLGCRNEELGYIYPLHSNKFNFNEDILLTGIQIFYNLYKRL